MNIAKLMEIFGNSIYFMLALSALWGAFCTIMVWRRVNEKRFKNEDDQNQFLSEMEAPLAQGNFEAAGQICQGDLRALAQLAYLAIANRDLGYGKVRHLVQDRFQRDVLSDLDHRLSWVYTMIKVAPMLGLLGTVAGMMGAFGKLAAAENVKADVLAGDISLALITTALGLSIAIPLVLCTASINVSIRKFEELVGVGLSRFMENYRAALAHSPPPEK